MGGMTEVAPAASTEHEATDEVERLAASIYGTIVASSVLAASASNLSIGETCLAVIVTVLVYWLAETYAASLAARTVATPERFGDYARHHARRTWRMVTASLAPLAALLVAAALGAGVTNAILAALGLSTLTLAALGWVAAGRAGIAGLSRLGIAATSSVAGLVLIGLKLSLH
jgi:hypothetical protein